MSEPRRISPAGIDLVKRFEGFRARPARLPGGRFLYGYGHVSETAPEAALDEPEADRLLTEDLRPYEALVAERVLAPMTAAQFDALVSFAFSVGSEAFLQSAVARAMSEGAPIAAADALDAWRASAVLGRPVTLDALVRRRAAEKALFLSDPPAAPAPSAYVAPLADPAWRVAAAPVADAPRLAEAPDAEELARLRRIMAAHPATAAVLRPAAPSEAFEEEAPAPIPAAAPILVARPVRAVAISDTVGLSALGLLGAGLLALAALAWSAGGADSRWTATLFATPGAVALTMALYYLVLTGRAERP